VLLVIFLSNQYRLKKSLTAANVLLTEKMYKIEKMNTELIQLNNLKNKFFSVLSHDLREPISALITTVSMLQNDFKDENKRQVIVSKMSDGLLYAQELLNNTLLWSKSQLNKEKTELLPIAVATTLKDTLFYYEANANQKGIQLQHNLAEANIMSEPTLLQGIVRNVLSNAVKFTNEGGAIAVNSTTSGNTYELEIVDNGIGVDEQLLAEWRSGYFFKSTKGTNKEPGSGLGLAIVFDLMKQSNANIEISSQPNKGTRVKLIFTLV
jgi:signal transduction histidine kinase